MMKNGSPMPTILDLSQRIRLMHMGVGLLVDFHVTNHPQGQEHRAGIRGEQASLSTLLDEPDSTRLAWEDSNSKSAPQPESGGNREEAGSHPLPCRSSHKQAF